MTLAISSGVVVLDEALRAHPGLAGLFLGRLSSELIVNKDKKWRAWALGELLSSRHQILQFVLGHLAVQCGAERLAAIEDRSRGEAIPGILDCDAVRSRHSQSRQHLVVGIRRRSFFRGTSSPATTASKRPAQPSPSATDIRASMLASDVVVAIAGRWPRWFASAISASTPGRSGLRMNGNHRNRYRSASTRTLNAGVACRRLG